jgi:AcrR family transcriptional regulator
MINNDDPRVKRTRQLIRQAFINLTEEKGFKAVTIKDIAERATVNRATFYAHYEDKNALLNDLTEEAFYKMITDHLEPTDTFTEAACRQLILLTYEYAKQFYQICKINTETIGALIDERVKQILQKKIEEMILTGQPLNPTTQIASAMISASIYAVGIQMSLSSPKNVDDLINCPVLFIMAGLQAIKS